MKFAEAVDGVIDTATAASPDDETSQSTVWIPVLVVIIIIFIVAAALIGVLYYRRRTRPPTTTTIRWDPENVQQKYVSTPAVNVNQFPSNRVVLLFWQASKFYTRSGYDV